jgi:hypothetical protein
VLALGAVLVLMAWQSSAEVLMRPRWTYRDPNRLRAVGTWLAENSRPGEIVLNVSWGMFPELFFWNPSNHYVSGLDPIFLFAYDEGLYWQLHHLASGDTTSQTCSSMECGEGEPKETYALVARDLNAVYVVLDRNQHHALADYLASDSRFTLSFSQGTSEVYAVD